MFGANATMILQQAPNNAVVNPCFSAALRLKLFRDKRIDRARPGAVHAREIDHDHYSRCPGAEFYGAGSRCTGFVQLHGLIVDK